MTRTLTSTDLAPFYRNAIGIDSLFDRLDHLNRVSEGSTNYPPYNIIKHSEDEYSIEVAVAGFAEGEVDISFKDGQVVIEGNKAGDETETSEYLHKGISGRKFVRTFQLAEYIEVKSATMENGILTVSLVRLLPERLQPKKIEIVHKS